jgi:Bacterial protein of unknown function (DUF916)
MPTTYKNILMMLCGAALIVQLANYAPINAETTEDNQITLSLPDKKAPVFFLKGEPGHQIEATYTLTNTTSQKETTTVYSTISNFIISKDGLLRNDTTERTSDQNLASWITLANPEVKLNQGESKNVRFTVKIPDGAKGGTFSALATFATTPREEKSFLTAENTGMQLGLPIFVTIAKDVSFTGDIQSMAITDQGDTPRQLFLSPSAKLNIEIQNTGNVYTIPVGDVFVYKKEKTGAKAIPFNTEGLLIQPGNSRNYSLSIPLNGLINEGEKSLFKKINVRQFFDFKFGEYNATYQAILTPSPEAGLSLGAATITEKTISFFVLPVQLIILVLLLLTVFVYSSFRYISKFRKNTKFQRYRIR